VCSRPPSIGSLVTRCARGHRRRLWCPHRVIHRRLWCPHRVIRRRLWCPHRVIRRRGHRRRHTPSSLISSLVFVDGCTANTDRGSTSFTRSSPTRFVDDFVQSTHTLLLRCPHRRNRRSRRRHHHLQVRTLSSPTSRPPRRTWRPRTSRRRRRPSAELLSSSGKRPQLTWRKLQRLVGRLQRSAGLRNFRQISMPSVRTATRTSADLHSQPSCSRWLARRRSSRHHRHQRLHISLHLRRWRLRSSSR